MARLGDMSLGGNALGSKRLSGNALGSKALQGFGNSLGIQDIVWTERGFSTRQREAQIQAEHARILAQRRRDELTITDVERIAKRYGIVIDVGYVDRYGFVDDIWSEDDPAVADYLNSILYTQVYAAQKGIKDWGKYQSLAQLRKDLPKRGTPNGNQIARLADELGLDIYEDDDGNMWSDDYDFNQLVLGVVYSWQDEEFRHLTWSQQKQYIKEAYRWINYNPYLEHRKMLLASAVSKELGISPTVSGKTGKPVGQFAKFINAFNDSWDAYHSRDIVPWYSDMLADMQNWQALSQAEKQTKQKGGTMNRKHTRRQNKYYENLSLFGKFKHKFWQGSAYNIHDEYVEKDDRVWWNGEMYVYGKY